MSASAVLNIVLNVILIPFWNENAAAFSTVLAEMCMFVVNYFYARDLVKDVFISKTLLHTFISSVIGCIGIVLVCILCNLSFRSLIVKTIFSVVLSVIIYGTVLVLLKNKFAISMLNRTKMILKDKF